MIAGRIRVHPEGADEYVVELHNSDVLGLGRKPGMDISQYLVFPQMQISGLHAAIYCKRNYWAIKDCASTNGTQLNGAKLIPQQRYRLEPGDQITLAGRITIAVESCPCLADSLMVEKLKTRHAHIAPVAKQEAQPVDQYKPFKLEDRLIAGQ